MSTLRLVFAGAILLGIAEALYYYPLLPDRVAIHFNAAGIADAWGPKSAFLEIFGLVFNIVAVLFCGLALLLRRIPDSMMNLPNKDYWLAPERREQTMARLTDQMFFTGAMTLILLDALFFLTMKANLTTSPTLPATLMWAMIIGFIVINIAWIVSMLRSFRLPDR